MNGTKFEAIFSQDRYRLPMEWDGKDFYATLFNHLTNYHEDIKKKYHNEFKLCSDVKTVCFGLCAAIDFSFRGYPGKAYQRFESVMKILSKDPLLINAEKINKEPLYRVVDVGNATIPNRQRIFHVPFSLRSKMSTYRYSIPGFPCLYLATSVDLCCMELEKYQQRDYVWVSRYELQTDHRNFCENSLKPVFDNDRFIVFDVSLKPEQAIETQHDPDQSIAEFRKRYIKWYPLIAACSYIRAVRDAHYSAELIIPHLLIQWVRSVDEAAVVGIKYFSCASVEASKTGNNYVFPTMGTPYHTRKTISDYCARLSHRFKLTEPRFIMDYEDIVSCEKSLIEDNNLEYIDDFDSFEEEEITGEYSIPERVSAIGAFAFYNCYSLTSINIPNSVTSIGDDAFYSCNLLTEINIPDSVTTIGAFAFFKCRSLQRVNLPNRITCINQGAFSDCTALKTIKIPDSVKSIGNRAFSGCSALKRINIPNRVIRIHAGAFSGCSSLTEITIPNRVKSIGESAFSDCISLPSITIPDNVTSIRAGTFSGCIALSYISIPDGVTSIGDSSFSMCNSLRFIVIPDSVTRIGINAFECCNSLTEINLPNHITTIEDGVFSMCIALPGINIPKWVTSIGNSAFSECISLTRISIPDSVKSIGENAFECCTTLTSINIPNSVMNIGDNAFAGCRSLKTVYYHGTPEQAEKINVGRGNDDLLNATWVFGSSGNEK